MYRVCIGNVTDEKSSEEVRIQATETHRKTRRVAPSTKPEEGTITTTMLLLQSEYQGIKGRKRKNKYFFKQKICTCEIFVVILQLN